MAGTPPKLQLLLHLRPTITADVARFRAAGWSWREIARWIADTTNGEVAPVHESVRNWFGDNK